MGIGLNLDDLESGRTGVIYPPLLVKCGKTVCGNVSTGASRAASYEPYAGNGDGPLKFIKYHLLDFSSIWQILRQMFSLLNANNLCGTSLCGPSRFIFGL